MLVRADCADFGCHNSIRLETKHFLNTLALTFISFSGRLSFFFASDPLVVFQSIFLLAFFGYLRLASIVPSSSKFSLHKVLLRKHFIRCPMGFKVHIPSTKTHQLYFQFHELFIPFIQNFSLCPVTALTAMFHKYPASPDSPAFVVPRGGKCVPL